MSAWFSKLTVLELAMLGWWALSAVLLLRAQRTRPLFDLTDAVTGDNGRVSATRLVAMIGISAATWIVLYKAIAGTLSDEMFMVYFYGTCGTLIFGKTIGVGEMLAARGKPPVSEVQTSTTTTEKRTEVKPSEQPS